MTKLEKLFARQDVLLAEMRALADLESRTDEQEAEYVTAENEYDANEGIIARETKLAAAEAKAKEPDSPGYRPTGDGTDIVIKDRVQRPFRNFVEQLHAIKEVASTGNGDERLNVLNAVLGGNEGLGSEGGFAVQTDIAGAMLETAAKSGQILSRVDQFTVSDGSNAVKWVDVDETTVATTVFGGVQVFWAAEAAAVTATLPKLQERELKLEKLMGLAYATYELEKDSSFVNDLYTRAFEKAIQRELEGTIVSGTGVGKPLGFLTGGSLVTISKEAGQVAATVVWKNITKMFNRTLDKTSPGLVWLMHPDVHEQLDFLDFPVGTGGVPVYLQSTKDGDLDALKGRGIVDSDHCSALGTKGDFNLVDLNEYLLAVKGGVDTASSIHVQFLTAQNAFRFIFRANGMPKKKSALTIKNSTLTRSSFVSLATRA